MRNFDLDKVRFFSIIVGMCLVLVLVVWKAYDYLPREENDNQNIEYEDPTYIDAEEQPQSISEIANQYMMKQTNQSESKQFEMIEKEPIAIVPKQNLADKRKNLIPLETIMDDPVFEKLKKNAQNIQKKEDEMTEMLSKAEEFLNDNAFDMAILEYQDIINITENEDTKAVCYDNIAKIYEKQRRFGSAIVNAQKANSIIPTETRKNYLNSLYEKTGYKK